MIRLAIGCVTEPTPKFLNQTILLLQTLRHFGGSVAQCDFYVGSTGRIPDEYMDELIRYSPNIFYCERNLEHPHSNKLHFLEYIMSEDMIKEYTHIMLLDCDTVICGDFAEYVRRTTSVSAKYADKAGVPSQLFRKIFKKFNIAWPGLTAVSDIDAVPMPPYYNAGVMIFTYDALKSLLPTWLYYNSIIITTKALHPRQFFTDQVSFAVAIAELGIKVTNLPPKMNYPTHFPVGMYPDTYQDVFPLIIHHHNKLDDHGGLMSLPFEGVKLKIREINHHISQSWRTTFNQARFWDTRYEIHPKLGSGSGSRGDLRDYKANLVEDALKGENGTINTVLDIACGDQQVLQRIRFPHYIGVDISTVAIQKAQHRGILATSEKYFAGDFTKLPLQTADLVICLDMLIHMGSYQEYYWAVQKLVDLTGKTGLVSGYCAPTGDWGIVFYYEPLKRTLKEAGATNIKRVGEYRGIEVYQFGPINRDFGLE